MSRALAVVAASAVFAGCGGDRQGPLDETVDGSSWVGGKAKPGEWYVVGVATPTNTSDDEAVLDDIEPADESEATGLKLRYGTTSCRIGSAVGWPPRWCRRGFQPLRGHRVPPSERALIVVGAKADRQGRWFIKSFRVRYRAGDDRFTTVYRQGLCIRVTGVSSPLPCDG